MKEAPVRRKTKNVSKKKKGLVLIFTGDGKGKTTAALGTAMRCAGNRMKVFMVQFIKGNWKCGELAAAGRLSPFLEIRPMGKGFTWESGSREENIALARDAWALGCRKMRSGIYDLVIFDEILYAIDYGFLEMNEVILALKQKPEKTHVLLTGRNAARAMIDAADLVTEMREIKHPFLDGIAAQRGIEF